VQGDIVHFEVPVVVRPPDARKIVIRGPAGRDHDVHELALDEAAQDAAHASRHERGREGQERRASPSSEQGPKDRHAIGDLLRREAAAAPHRIDEGSRHGHLVEVDVLDLAAEHVSPVHRAGIRGIQ